MTTLYDKEELTDYFISSQSFYSFLSLASQSFSQFSNTVVHLMTQSKKTKQFWANIFTILGQFRNTTCGRATHGHGGIVSHCLYKSYL